MDSTNPKCQVNREAKNRTLLNSEVDEEEMKWRENTQLLTKEFYVSIEKNEANVKYTAIRHRNTIQ